MGRGVDAGKSEAWRRRLARFEAGRLTVAAFCESEGVSPPTFYSWKRKLRATPPPVEATKPATLASAPSFLPVQVRGAATVEIELPCGVLVRVPSHDVRAIAAAIAAAAGAAEASSC